MRHFGYTDSRKGERMRLQDIQMENSTKERPSDLAAAYYRHEVAGGTLYNFLTQYEYESRQEVEKAFRDLAYCIAGDKYLSDKDTQKNDVYARCIWSRFNKIVTTPDRFDKLPTAVSGEVWHSGYSKHRINERTKHLLDTEVTHDEWVQVSNRIQGIYGLTACEMEKIHYFVEQVKAGTDFPPSLRRMLYIWGSAKMTGKTTTATMIVSILNGERDYTKIARYSTNLAYELQVKSFAVPKISECNCCLMDECFFADMGKMYADFKRFLTSRGGTARLPYGQEFAWDGCPNYVATSNDPLKRFIKDWDDRRYLSIEFATPPTERMDFGAIYDLWLRYIAGSRRECAWSEWADTIAEMSNEVGERTERANEYAIELQRPAFLDYLLSQVLHSDKPYSTANRISLKFFVDYFSRDGGAAETNKRRDEIEAAVVAVFGQRYSTCTYWLLSELQERARQMKRDMDKVIIPDDMKVGDTDKTLPF